MIYVFRDGDPPEFLFKSEMLFLGDVPTNAYWYNSNAKAWYQRPFGAGRGGRPDIEDLTDDEVPPMIRALLLLII